MKIEYEVLEEMTIEQFADKHGLVMKVCERDCDGPMRFYAHFKNAEVKDGSVLSGTHGNGETDYEAIANYAKNISRRTLVIDASGPERRVIHVPRLVLEPNAFADFPRYGRGRRA